MIRCKTKGTTLDTSKYNKSNLRLKDIYIFVGTTNGNKCEKAC